MNSFDLSESYNITHDQSLTTIHLFTEEKALSLIDQLHSSESSSHNLSPQILFSGCPNNSQKASQKQDNKHGNLIKMEKAISSLGKNNTTFRSFQIQNEQDNTLKVKHLVPVQVPSQQEELYSNVESQNTHNIHQIFKDKLTVHFTESRQLILPNTLNDQSKSVRGVDYFQRQVQNLKQSVQRLKNAIDRASTASKSESGKTNRYPQKPINRALVYESASSQNLISKLHAKSTESHEWSQTPKREEVQIRQFLIQGLSPILSYSRQNGMLNVEQKSSKKLIMKKLSRRRNQNSI